MISLHSEITDTKGSKASRGWICFDRDCSVCTGLARRFERTFAKRGFGLAALQDARVASLLALPPEELLREMRVLTANNERYGGADAIIFLAKQIWWAWPFYAVFRLPGMRRALQAGYRWFADHRNCSSGMCAVTKKGPHGDPISRARGESSTPDKPGAGTAQHRQRRKLCGL